MSPDEFYKLPIHKKQAIVVELRKRHTLEKIAEMFAKEEIYYWHEIHYYPTRERVRQLQYRIKSLRDDIDHNMSERTIKSLDKHWIHTIDKLKQYTILELKLMQWIWWIWINEIKQFLLNF